MDRSILARWSPDPVYKQGQHRDIFTVVTMYNPFILSIITSLFALINATPVSQDAIVLPQYSIPPSFPAECHGRKILKQTYIGEFNNVLASYYTCSGTCSDTRPATTFTSPTLKTTTNECDAPCTTTCFTPAGGGPDPHDCTVIADALLFEGQNKGPDFNIVSHISPPPIDKWPNERDE